VVQQKNRQQQKAEIVRIQMEAYEQGKQQSAGEGGIKLVGVGGGWRGRERDGPNALPCAQGGD